MATEKAVHASAVDSVPKESHNSRHHAKNKKSDPFLELDDQAIKLPDQPSPSNESENAVSQSESLLSDVRLSTMVVSDRLTDNPI